MANLRILQVVVVDSVTITATFSDNLDPAINTSNVSIAPQTTNIPVPLVTAVSTNTNTLTVTCQPLTPFIAYFINFHSGTVRFKSLNGLSSLLEDGITNQQLIIGPPEPANSVYDFLINYINPKDNIYNVSDQTTIINKYVQALTSVFSKALYDIRQVKNENYISFVVTDEKHTRTLGPFDRLLEEGAYEILRVGLAPTGTNTIFTLTIPNFDNSDITLLTSTATEILTPSSIDGTERFNINDLTLTVLNSPVTKLDSLTFIYNDGYAPFTYDIQTFGYQLLDSRYDKNLASTYLLLNNNQIKLNAAILGNASFLINNIIQIQATYEYKDLGRIVNSSTVEVTTVLQSVREVLPPIENVFNLQHAPITDINGNISGLGGLTFTNLIGLTTTTPHPAFLTEIPFSFGNPPVNPGEYSVDYVNGTVYVYGADTTQNGTGPTPPLVTYYYQFAYKPSIDYAYDPDTNDLAALPNGNLIENAGTITFNYEQVLIPGIDYIANIHKESLNERIQNRLIALNALKTENAPITNVFRIFNETTGEIYNTVRWNNDKVYFTYVTPPDIKEQIGERASFSEVLNEILFVDRAFTNSNNVGIFQCLLQNNTIIDGTEDGIGSSINSSAKFSNSQIFVRELWYDANETSLNNINRITGSGQYTIDYANGIVYVGVANPSNIDIGTISYKSDVIVPQFPHIISVDDIYYRISFLNPKDKEFTYNRFSDGEIVPSTFDVSDEAFLGDIPGEPYQVVSNQIGAFVVGTFVPVVSNNIKFIRSILEFDDLKFNAYPINFGPFATFNSRTITVNPATGQSLTTVQHETDGYFVLTNLNSSYLSPNLTYTFTVTRLSDGYSLWNGSGMVVIGAPIKLILPGINNPLVGDGVVVTYSISINNLSRVIVDYNKGEYYIDYAYLADEILISYEYGDNLIDFRQSKTILPETVYYASYRVGALRDALLKNFGTLIDIPELSVFETDFERERYRDALSAALSTFIQGPTVAAMKSLVEQVSHIEPELIESAFNNWTLGNSLLNPIGIETEGTFQLLPSKYDNGVLIDTDGQTITFPVSSNLRLENGTFECWITPNWNGIDNDATITVSITKDGYTDGYILPEDQVFIGAAEYHPVYSNNQFTLTKNSNVVGVPNKNKDGVYLYYAPDPSGIFDRWYCEVVDGYSDGYSDGYGTFYNIKISSDGIFYDVKANPTLQSNFVGLRTGLSSLTSIIGTADGYDVPFDQGITFVSDLQHYILDFGETSIKNRLSIYKDAGGYMNLKVWDKNSVSYVVSTNISKWQSNQLHHIAAAWAMNTPNNRDELHLFIDGLEIPNIIRYGNKVQPYLDENFRTVNPEEIAGVITRNIVASIDLKTIAGSQFVTSSINFSAVGITNGSTLFIDEPGFNISGYTVINVNGNTLTLSVSMPLSITNGKFSVNRVSLDVITEIDIYPNITVSTISSILDGSDMNTIQGISTITSTGTNFTTAGVLPGYLVRIDNGSFRTHYTILSVSGHSLVINDVAPLSLTNATFHIYISNPIEIPGQRAVNPAYSISVDGYFNNILTISNDAKTNDLILIETLGINHKRTRQQYYQWGSGSNVIITRLPPPVSLNQVSVTHILLGNTIINSNNSTLVGNHFTSNALITDQPSTSNFGRTLALTVTTNNNLIFPADGYITGTIFGGGTVTETVAFNQAGTQNTINKFLTVTDGYVIGNAINTAKNFLVFQIAEAFPITTPEAGSTVYPVIRFSYQVLAGSGTLSGDGNTITDSTFSFSSLDIGNYVVISATSPFVAGVVGTYQITSVSANFHSATINASIPSFTGGTYQVLNATTFRSGFQNGFFVFEDGYLPGVPYNLMQGLYQLDYFTYLSIRVGPLSVDAFLGTDFNGNNLLNGVISEVKIISGKLTDTRIGESPPVGQETITLDYNSLKQLQSDKNTLMLAHLNKVPLTNNADFYIHNETRQFVQSSISVNDNFSQSVIITDTPIVIENDGIINNQQGTIEFWVSPMFDTQNDPNYEFYFDATSTQIENVISMNEASVITSGRIGTVISVKLQDGDQTVDYFAGGKVETSTQGAIQETGISASSNTVVVSKTILQVITVKIVGDATHTDYFAGGVVGTDNKTIYLGKTLPETNLELIVTYKPASGGDQILNSQIIRLNRQLPYQNTPVTVTYIPNGTQGDRMSIYKDPSGYINFNVTASGIDYIVRAPALWASNTWHRIKAIYNINGGQNNDTVRLFIDGYERGNILFGTGLLFGDPHVFGSSFVGSSTIHTNIVFKDIVNEIFIGSDYTRSNTANASLDNLRVSNIARPVYSPFGESIDVNYNSNISSALPVPIDLYTTLLLDFDTLITLNSNFATLKNKNDGNNDFTLNILDSFDIISSSDKVKAVLEAMINQLKPATSRAFLNYLGE